MGFLSKKKKAVEPEELPEPDFDSEVDCETVETTKPKYAQAKPKQAPVEAEPQVQLVSHEQLVLVRLDQLEAKIDKILKLAAE